MSKLVVLGSDGMIGSTVLNHAITKSLDAVGTSLRYNDQNKIFLDVTQKNFTDTIRVFPTGTYFVNCIGLIRHKIDNANQSLAMYLNSEYPRILTSFVEDRGYKLINICTDCVYSGSKGGYTENDLHDPVDLYGLSKSKGESISINVMNLRTSVIGPELKTKIELLEWVLNRKKNETIKGFVNHKWNGITSKALAKIIEGLVNSDNFFSGNVHVVPANELTKYELVKQITLFGNRNDLIVEPYETSISINRTLDTIEPKRNRDIWEIAGYESIPTIEELLSEVLPFM